jgi:hypothetical protein
MRGKPGGDSKNSMVSTPIQGSQDDFVKAVRGEAFSYIVKAVVTGSVAALCFALFAAWTYVEWRLKQMAGGVPNNAVVIFNKPDCPTGWKPPDGDDMRTIVVAAPRKAGDDDAHPKPLHFNQQRGGYIEYRLMKAPGDVRQLAENEDRVVVPGLLALTYCEKSGG